jgi:hypothetical protein
MRWIKRKSLMMTALPPEGRANTPNAIDAEFEPKDVRATENSFLEEPVVETQMSGTQADFLNKTFASADAGSPVAPVESHTAGGPGWTGVLLIAAATALAGGALGALVSNSGLLGAGGTGGNLQSEVARLGAVQEEHGVNLMTLGTENTSLRSELAKAQSELAASLAKEDERALSVQLMRREIDEMRQTLAADASRLAIEALEPLKRRLAAIEAVEGKKPVTDRTLVRAVAGLQARIAEVEAEPPSASNDRLEALAQRLTVLEQGFSTSQSSEPAGVASADPAAEKKRGLIAAVIALESAASTSAPFVTSVDAVGRADPSLDLKTLREIARTGAPTLAQLRTEFDLSEAESLKALATSSGPVAGQSGAFDWLRQTTGGMVVIRRGEDAGDDAPRSRLARARDRLQTGDVAAAAAALDVLPGPAAQAMTAWVARAKRRAELEAEINRLRARLLAEER